MMSRSSWGWIVRPRLVAATAALSSEMPPQSGGASLEPLDAGAFTQRLSHNSGAGTPSFTVAALPDTQFYAAKYPEMPSLDVLKTDPDNDFSVDY